MLQWFRNSDKKKADKADKDKENEPLALVEEDSECFAVPSNQLKSKETLSIDHKKMAQYMGKLVFPRLNRTITRLEKFFDRSRDFETGFQNRFYDSYVDMREVN